MQLAKKDQKGHKMANSQIIPVFQASDYTLFDHTRAIGFVMSLKGPEKTKEEKIKGSTTYKKGSSMSEAM